MASEAQRSARKLKAGIVARMHDPATSQHQGGLLGAMKLCERFINANATSLEEYAVLKEEVAKVMLAQQQGRSKVHTAAHTGPAHQISGLYSKKLPLPKASNGSLKASYKPTRQQQQQYQKEASSVKQASRLHSSLPATNNTLMAVNTAWQQDLDVVPTVLMEHKAHLTENDFDHIVKLQDQKAQEEDRQWECDKRRQQQQLRSMLAAQVAERDAVREAERQAKLREVQETDEALAAAYQAELQEIKQRKAAQQRQWNLYREQQEQAEARHQAAAEAAAREQAIERAEVEAAQAAEAAGAAARAVANRARLEAFKAETIAALEAKRHEAALRQEKERIYTEECKRAMDNAEAKRIADKEAWRQKQQAKYMSAGGVDMEKKLEQEIKAAAAKAAREAAAHEAKLAAEAAARKASERTAALQAAAYLEQQMAEKTASRQAAATQKALEATTAAQTRLAMESALKAEKAAIREAKGRLLEQQKQELSEWRQRKFTELNAPLSEGDKWVHKGVLTGEKMAFTTMKDNRRL